MEAELSRSELRNKDFHIYSRSAFAHRVIITTTAGYWDKQERFKTLLFDNKPGCFVVFRVVDTQSVMIKEAQGVRACTDSLDQCHGAITSLVVENLEVDPSFKKCFFILTIFFNRLLDTLMSMKNQTLTCVTLLLYQEKHD